MLSADILRQMNPDDYIITRKRKKYKFAKFFNADNCFEYDEWMAMRHGGSEVSESFSLAPMPRLTASAGSSRSRKDSETSPSSVAPIVVELGAGTALFSVELAARHPEKFYVAIDVKADRLQKGAYMAIERGLKNIVFLRARADQIGELFSAHEISELWINFADPFPKKGSAGRRMTHPTFLRKYADVLAPDATLNIKHDNPDFFTWTLEQLVTEKWFLTALTFDLHETDEKKFSDAKIHTSYEIRWLADERTTQYIQAQRWSIQ